jgi:hypothetical protein
LQTGAVRGVGSTAESFVVQLETVALAVTPPTVKCPGAGILLPQLELQTDTAPLRQTGLGCIEERRAYAKGTRRGRHEEFIDFSHQALLLETENVDSQQVPDELIVGRRYPDCSKVGLQQDALQQR